MPRATRSRFEEDRLDEQCACAYKRRKARGALDEAGSCANAGGARVPAQVQRKDVHKFFGWIRGWHVRICFVAVGIAVACSGSYVGDNADADDRFDTFRLSSLSLSLSSVSVGLPVPAKRVQLCTAGMSHVQDLYSNPQVALPLLVEDFRGAQSREASPACTTSPESVSGVYHPSSSHMGWRSGEASAQATNNAYPLATPGPHIVPFSVNIYVFLLLNNISPFVKQAGPVKLKCT